MAFLHAFASDPFLTTPAVMEAPTGIFGLTRGLQPPSSTRNTMGAMFAE